MQSDAGAGPQPVCLCNLTQHTECCCAHIACASFTARASRISRVAARLRFFPQLEGYASAANAWLADRTDRIENSFPNAPAVVLQRRFYKLLIAHIHQHVFFSAPGSAPRVASGGLPSGGAHESNASVGSSSTTLLSNYWLLGFWPLRYVEICGVVVETHVSPRKLTYYVDDGTGVIRCVCWLKQSTKVVTEAEVLKGMFPYTMHDQTCTQHIETMERTESGLQPQQTPRTDVEEEREEQDSNGQQLRRSSGHCTHTVATIAQELMAIRSGACPPGNALFNNLDHRNGLPIGLRAVISQGSRVTVRGLLCTAHGVPEISAFTSGGPREISVMSIRQEENPNEEYSHIVEATAFVNWVSSQRERYQRANLTEQAPAQATAIACDHQANRGVEVKDREGSFALERIVTIFDQAWPTPYTVPQSVKRIRVEEGDKIQEYARYFRAACGLQITATDLISILENRSPQGNAAATGQHAPPGRSLYASVLRGASRTESAGEVSTLITELVTHCILAQVSAPLAFASKLANWNPGNEIATLPRLTMCLLGLYPSPYTANSVSKVSSLVNDTNESADKIATKKVETRADGRCGYYIVTPFWFVAPTVLEIIWRMQEGAGDDGVDGATLISEILHLCGWVKSTGALEWIGQIVRIMYGCGHINILGLQRDPAKFSLWTWGEDGSYGEIRNNLAASVALADRLTCLEVETGIKAVYNQTAPHLQVQFLDNCKFTVHRDVAAILSKGYGPHC